MADDYEQFLQTHQSQLVDNRIPVHLYRRLYEKMRNEIFDSGRYFQICPVDDDNDELVKPFNPERAFYVSTTEDVILDLEKDENAIFLIDHAWTYRINDAENDLKSIPNLYERMAVLMNVNSDDKDDGIELILQRMWKFNQTRTQISGQPSYWYIMDELGSAIRHSSSNANVCCTTFFFEPSQTTFTLLYPIVRIEQLYTEIFRNFLSDHTDALDRNVRLLPWQRLNYRKKMLRNLTIENCPEIFQRQDHTEIFERDHENELYDKTLPNQEERRIDNDRIWKVYTDQNLVKEYLTDPHYQFIGQCDQADIIFLKSSIRDFRFETLHGTLINQFPWENVMINKELLTLIARRWKPLFGSPSSQTDPYIDSYGIPPWFPMTFPLTYELPQFAVYYQYREDQQIDNTWIIKPIDSTQTTDVSITSLFDMILRLPESGSKIACKYIPTSFLLDGRKFDLRYFLLLRTIRPLKLYVHKIVQPRFASAPFSTKEPDDDQIDCTTFSNMFNEQHGESWSIVEQRVFQMFRELFHCATSEEPPLGMGACFSSRAVYAADVIFEINDKNEIQPKLLAMHPNPDCHRQNFYNQIFNVLFRDLIDEQHVRDISI